VTEDAHTESTGPSILQVRAQYVTPAHFGNLVLSALSTHRAVLESGAFDHRGRNASTSTDIANQAQVERTKLMLQTGSQRPDSPKLLH